jgi:Fe-S oxidoreductase
VDYPKLLGKSTAELGLAFIHISEFIHRLLRTGKIRFERRLDMKLTYHDPCNLGRLSEPWTKWEGRRKKAGQMEPPKEFRRGTNGAYHAPRNVLESIPGMRLLEMKRFRENAWCCGAGGGVKDAFGEFALWAGIKRIEEAQKIHAEGIVSCCPHCKVNFMDARKSHMAKFGVYDLSEIVAMALPES